ncbi:MAG: hypothetical protein AB8G05_16635 [Oligoflexales bacterium]
MPQVFTRGDYKGKNRLFRQTLADAEQLTTRDEIQEEMEKRAREEATESFYKSIERRLKMLNAEPLDNEGAKRDR